MKITDEQIDSITWRGDTVYDDENKIIFEVVERVMSDYDLEKEWIEEDVTIKEIATGNFYKTTLIKCYHLSNDNIEWTQVYPHEKIVTVYTLEK